MKHIAPQFEIRWEEPEDFKLESPIEIDADEPKHESLTESVNEPTLFD